MSGIATTRVIKGAQDDFEAAVAAAIHQISIVNVSSAFHAAESTDILTFTNLSGTDTAATNAAIAAGNEWMIKYLEHIADTLAHKVAGTAPSLTAATDLTTLETLINAIKADHNTHIGDTALHYNADATNTIASADANSLASAQTMLNEAKNTTGFNAHVASAPAISSILRING